MFTTDKKGQIAEGAIMSALLKRGVTVLLPLGYSHRFDMVLDIAGKLFKVQCKSGRLRRGVIEFNTCSMNNVTHKKRDYRGQVDLFAVWEPTTDAVYLVEPDKVGKEEGYLRLEATKFSKNVQFAKDFRLDIVLQKFGVVG